MPDIFSSLLGDYQMKCRVLEERREALRLYRESNGFTPEHEEFLWDKIEHARFDVYCIACHVCDHIIQEQAFKETGDDA